MDGIMNVFGVCLQYFPDLLKRFLQSWRYPRAQEVFPIRVIDLRATLDESHGGIHFIAPTDWNFHVMSHTWSMEVREFSKEIGKQMGTLQAGRCRLMPSRLYDRCFEQADLRGQPAYHSLITFLQLLFEDGVTHLWFDALCINQTDNDEKSKEIGYMGDYYSRSRGCYALVHGIGQGYDLWPGGRSGEALPRWFDRIWTIQEFALPGSLLVVTELSDSVHKLANRLMRKAHSSAGFCRCCIFKEVLSETSDTSGLMQELLSIDGSSDVSLESSIDYCGQSASVCSECGESSLVKILQHTILGRAIYMVEREAYLFLLFLDSFLTMQHAVWTQILRTVTRIVALYKFLERSWDAWSVLAEVRQRECTHDEDRVLGILGLLGVGGDTQLRTGQSLEQQLVHVVNHCNPDLLLKLCTVDFMGGVVPGMSWAPNFRGPWFVEDGIVMGFQSAGSVQFYFGQKDKEQPQPLDVEGATAAVHKLDKRIRRLSDFNRQVKILKVADNGMIMLEGKAVVGQVMPCERLSSKDREAMAQKTFLKDHTPTHCIHFHEVGIILPLIVNLRWNTHPNEPPGRRTYIPELVMAPAVQPWHPIFLQLPNNQAALEALQSRPSQCLAEDQSSEESKIMSQLLEILPPAGMQRLEDSKMWIHAEVRALLLGTVGNGSYSVTMMCVGKGGSSSYDVEELHKIGIVVLPIEIGSTMFGISSQGLHKVGGFGPDLSEFVTIINTRAEI